MKKVLSVFLALVMLLSVFTVGISAAESTDYLWVSASRYGAKIDNYIYFPVFYDDDQSYARFVDENSETRITFPFFYNPEILKPVGITPSEMLYGMNFTGEISVIDVYTQINKSGYEITYPYFYVDITFDGGAEIEKGDVLFNVQLEIVGETASNVSGELLDSYFIVEDLENSVRTCAEWKITDENGIVKDISSQIQHNYRPYPGTTEDYLTLEGYEPFIPPVEKGKLNADTKFESGETYYINNYEDFKTFVNLINAGQTGQGSRFELTSDIIINHGKFSLDANNEPLYVGYPITKTTKLIECEPASDFRGTLDGKNHSIMGYYSTTSGIFDLLYRAEVKNLCIKNSLFDLRGSSAESAGALCAKADNYPQIRNIIFNGIIINDGAITGGLVGESIKAHLYDCRNRGTVIGDDYCGGLVGKVTNDCSLLDCANNGTVLSTGDYVGGIVANITPNVDVKRCANPGTVKSTGNYVGGIAGDINMDNNMVEDCYHTGTVSGNDYVGGLGGNFYSAGDNLEDLWAEYDAVEEERLRYGQMLQGDKLWIDVWPPAWADDHYMELWDRSQTLYQEILDNMPKDNFLSSYSAGSVTANGNYVGGLFGGFDGCLLRFGSLHYNNSISGLRSTGYDQLEYEAIIIGGGQIGTPLAWTDTQLKSEHFARQIGTNEYTVDTTNENNGYVILRALLSDETEPGYTDITQNVTDLTLGTTDTITFAADETKTYKFTPETDGDYKVTVSAVKKAAVVVKAYKNGDPLEERNVLKLSIPVSLTPDMKDIDFYEISLNNLLTTDKITLEIFDCTNYTEEGVVREHIQLYATPSSINISVENTTPVIEEQPLFEFGVTAQHIRNKFDMLYYPVSFGFSMYDDADIRYSDICADVADLAFGCDTEIVMKYIYDATTLDFVYVYDDSWNGSVEVLEHGSTDMTGDEGQEYNYIILKAKFSAVGYADGKAPFFLKFAVVEDNFINSDGTVRKVIDNVPYSEDQLCVWNAWDHEGDSFDFSNRIEFKSSDYETSGQTYDDLLLEDDIIATDVDMPTVTFTPEHARKGDLAYYPCTYDSNVDYDEWVRSATGFKDSTTKIQIKVDYDSSTLELLDALPSKELYDLGGTVTIIETGDLYPDNPDYGHMKYAVVQLDFDALDFTDGCLFSLKFRVLQENFLDEEGRPIDLVNSFVADWVVTSNDGKSHDLRYYVSSSYLGLATFGSYEELILADYEPFDPTLIEIEDRFEIVGGATVMTQGGVNYIVGLQPSLTKTKFQSTYIDSENVTVEINMSTARYLGTGSTVTVKSEITGEVVAEYVVVIYGDVDGSATINGRDAAAVSNSITGVADSLTGAAKLAANVEGTRTTINAKDAAVINSVTGGTMIIDQTTGKGIAA